MGSISSELTVQDYWDHHWRNLQLPAQITPGQRSDRLTQSILDVFEKYIPDQPGARVLEIGGAPGRFLTYWARQRQAEVHCLDFSHAGCEKTRDNFRLLGLQVTIYETSLRDAWKKLPPYDIVYSLGFIEHFTDTDAILEEHWRLLKPGGYLVVGTPHFLNVFWPFLEKYAPRITSGHNRSSLNPKAWNHLEAVLKLERLFAGYISGFEPGPVCSVLEEEWFYSKGRKPLFAWLLYRLIQYFCKMRACFRRLFPAASTRRWNSKYWSSYSIGVYRKPVKLSDAGLNDAKVAPAIVD